MRSLLVGYGHFISVRVSGPTFSTLFMVRIRVRVILDCEITFICVHRYGGIISEDASRSQQGLGPDPQIFHIAFLIIKKDMACI